MVCNPTTGENTAPLECFVSEEYSYVFASGSDLMGQLNSCTALGANAAGSRPIKTRYQQKASREFQHEARLPIKRHGDSILWLTR